MKVRLGIDLGGSFIKAGILDDNFKILYRLQIPSHANKQASDVINQLKYALELLLAYCDKKRLVPQSLGLGSPGTIRQPDGKVTDASPNINGWRGTVLTKIFGRQKFPVFADNDANCAALAEFLIALKCRYNNIIFVTIGTGIGGGLIINCKLHRGSSFAAAEIGHASIKYDGKLCKCGRRGCLEAYASVPNMMKRASILARKFEVKLKPNFTPPQLFGLYKKGNRFARQTIIENTKYLGYGLAALVNVLNPEAIVVGGGFSGTGDGYIKLIHKETLANCLNVSGSGLKVVGAKLGNDAGFMGAAALYRVEKDGAIS
jgi:glucokinase